MFLSKTYQKIHGKIALLPFNDIVKKQMSMDVISSIKGTNFNEIPSLKYHRSESLNPSTKTEYSKSQDHLSLPNLNNQMLSKIQSYELSNRYNPQIIITKYSKEETQEEDALLNDKQRYQLLHYIATLKTPYISIVDKKISGFDASISILGGFKVVTENAHVQLNQSSFGASFYLSHLDGHLGVYLLMTQSCLTGKQLLFSGLASHYIHSSNIKKLEKELGHLNVLDIPSVNQVLESFSDETQNVELPFGGYSRTIIDSCFKYDSVEAILDALDTDGSPFALKTHHVISKDLQRARHCLEQIRVARSSPGLTDHLLKETTLSFLNSNDFSIHPYNNYLLPFESHVRNYIKDKLFFSSHEQGAVVQDFVNARNGKYGVREKVLDILERKTKRVQVGAVSKLIWLE